MAWKRRLRALDFHPDFLRERAKIYIQKRQWESALECLDKTIKVSPLYFDQNYGKPDRISLILRGQIKLMLCDNQGSLEDALQALKASELQDAVYCKALMLQADALFQMGDFEHALVLYHRGNRLKQTGLEEFKIGIQKATASIRNCLKMAKAKIKLDIHVEDTASSTTISKISFIFPHCSTSTKKRKASFRQKPSPITFCPIKANPFHKDIVELQKVVELIAKQPHFCDSGLRSFSDATLKYIKSRRHLWKKQEANNSEKKRGKIHDVDPSNLAIFHEQLNVKMSRFPDKQS